MKALLLVIALLLTSCGGGPSQMQLQADFSILHPDCGLLSSGPGEGDGDNVYIWFTYKCGGAKVQHSEVLYSLKSGRWVLNLEASRPR